MLPQFTLNARIIFFMMVMFATATTASLKKTNDVVIMLKNHERALHVNAGGKVTATDISLAQFFTMESVGDIFSDTFKIALYAKEAGRYLCFREGKLVGMKNLTRDCHFIESLEHGYFLYANAYNPLWRVGFTRGLKPVGPRHWKRPQTLKRACFLFVKINAEHFDRSRFTTTTTTTAKPRLTVKKSHTDPGTLSGNYKLHDSKASIIDSNNNNNNHKRTKSANHGQRHRDLNEESMNNTSLRRNRWPDKSVMEQRHRKRKHHVKLAASNNSGSSLQPKNLIRHRHDHQGNGEGRRRQHQREEKERKMRLQNQRRHNVDKNNTSNAEPIPSATNSASPSVAATTLAATASLAPSALNIVAMLAAGRRRRGRRKRQVETTNSNISSTNTGQQAMDLQLVAQSPLQVQTQYDRAQIHSTQHDHKHEHNYHQQQQRTSAPVNSTSTPKMEVKVQQQIHKYSNSNNTESQLYNSNSHNHSHSHSHNRSISNSSRSSRSNSSLISSNSRSHILRRIKRSSLNENTNNNRNNAKLNDNLYDNYLNGNDNDNDNKSKSNLNNEEYLMPTTTTRSSTDLKANLQQFSHYISKIHNTSTSNSNSNSNSTTISSHQKNFLTIKKASDISSPETHRDVIPFETHRLLVKNNKTNSSNIYKNSNNISDNNLQQEPLMLKRFKLIYLDRIRNRRKSHHSSQTNSQLNITNNSNNNSLINSATKQNHLDLKSFQNLNDFQKTFLAIKEKISKIQMKNKNNITITIDAAIATATTTPTIPKNIYTENNYSRSYEKSKTDINHNDNVTKITNSNSSSSSNSRTSGSSNSSKGKTSDSGSISSSSKNSIQGDIFNVLKYSHHKDKIVNSFNKKPQQQENYLNKLKSTTTATLDTATATATYTTTTYITNAYRHSSRILTILGQQHKLKSIRTTKNPNKYYYNNYNIIYNTNTNDNSNNHNNNNNNNNNNTEDVDDAYTYANNDEIFKRIQNKYEKIIVQYRSVVN